MHIPCCKFGLEKLIKLSDNQTILALTCCSFALFAVAEIVGAVFSSSLSLLGDAAAMCVDVFTYFCNMWAERIKLDGRPLSPLTRRILEIYIPLFSLIALVGVTAWITSDAIRIIIHHNEEDDKVNMLFVFGFSSVNLVVDIFSVCLFYVRRKHVFNHHHHHHHHHHHGEGEVIITHEEIQATEPVPSVNINIDSIKIPLLSHNHYHTHLPSNGYKLVSQTSIDPNSHDPVNSSTAFNELEKLVTKTSYYPSYTPSLIPVYPNVKYCCTMCQHRNSVSSKCSRNSKGSKSSQDSIPVSYTDLPKLIHPSENDHCTHTDLTSPSPRINVNMASAFTHVGADTLRTVTVFIAAITSSVTAYDSSICDAIAAIVVSASIVFAMGPLLYEIYKNHIRINYQSSPLYTPDPATTTTTTNHYTA